MNNLLQRLNRINAAIGAVSLKDFSRLQPQKCETASGVSMMHYDFSGGKSEAELLNEVLSLVHNVANLRDHLKRWAKRNGHGPAKVESTFQQSQDLKIIQDLSNSDKHGPERNGGYSGLKPSLGTPRRNLVLSNGAFCARLDGSEAMGNGGTSIQTNAPVLDEAGRTIGDIYSIAMNAVQAWETLLKDFGVTVRQPQTESRPDKST
jgi:hypothetical protein